MATVFIDIDGTLTDQPDKAGGRAIESRLRGVRKLIANGIEVVLWSARGAPYVREFARANSIRGVTCVSKPSVVVDDNLEIRPGGLYVVAPETYFNEPRPQ
jgi:hydroxymethylpyrimidine pyrophosphatase-like HAD family hydrolase